jgi:cell division transport system permease protein
MKLVGATKWYIMRPLLISALKQGLLSGIIASAMMCAMIYGVVAILPIGVATITPMELAVMSGVITLIGVVITVAFSAMAINKFVNMKSNKIHLY